MKRILMILLIVCLTPMLWSGTAADEYVILSWNDLGMHCANKDFSKICVLPPYNNLKAQVIKRGSGGNYPEIITSGFNVTYSIPGNTYSVGKTNFWTYASALFGVNLSPNIGLTGLGLTGVFTQTGNSYAADGIPVTPYQDNNLNSENPFQLALVELRDNSNNLIMSTQPVIPVSNEISCVSSGCHNSETAILNAHEDEGGFNPNNTPILCANCHASNALGTTGHAGVPSLSLAIHDKHKNRTSDCYKCHPGSNTQCFRDVMHTAGMVCQDCHGTIAQVASSIQNGREPWLEEPQCGNSSCHGSNYAENTGKLFRQSQGHGGLYCSACHGSPHAIQPTEQANDNVQNIAYQGTAGVLKKCEVCHGTVPDGPGPHGYTPVGINEPGVKSGSGITQITPNPFTNESVINFEIAGTAKVRIDVFAIDGQRKLVLLNETLGHGNYNVRVPANTLAPGAYLVKMRTGTTLDVKKIIVVR